jgi:ferredoxin
VPIVVFESPDSPPLEVSAPDGAGLMDLCDDFRATVPFSCRTASCGTCRIEVLEGADALEPAEDEELDVLDVFGDKPPDRRLCCQARLRVGAERVRVRPCED